MDPSSLHLSFHVGEHSGVSAALPDKAELRIDVGARYQICTQGLFDADWLDMLSGCWVIASAPSSAKDVTIFVGEVADQAALMGVLQQLYSLGFALLLVKHLVDQEQPCCCCKKGCSNSSALGLAMDSYAGASHAYNR